MELCTSYYIIIMYNLLAFTVSTFSANSTTRPYYCSEQTCTHFDLYFGSR